MYNPWFVQYNRKTLDTKKTANGKIITSMIVKGQNRSTLQNSELNHSIPRKEIVVGNEEVTIQHLFICLFFFSPS